MTQPSCQAEKLRDMEGEAGYMLLSEEKDYPSKQREVTSNAPWSSPWTD